MTRFVEISPIGQDFISPWQNFKCLICIWQNFEPTLALKICYWAIFLWCKLAKFRASDLAIWSHCSLHSQLKYGNIFQFRVNPVPGANSRFPDSETWVRSLKKASKSSSSSSSSRTKHLTTWSRCETFYNYFTPASCRKQIVLILTTNGLGTYHRIALKLFKFAIKGL